MNQHKNINEKRRHLKMKKRLKQTLRLKPVNLDTD